MEVSGSFGSDEQWSTFSIYDLSAPACWSNVPVTPFSADLISYFGGNLTADTTIFKADKTQF
tara:strand:+ start:1583 stop:1768 length:186 start_codon:yes stop_codon:yes gene_type:complete